ncbi:M4 family metallopeptidase [Variovorax paradoxus]|nr:M4 family metallopeptidase [Variovorax paradoxus]
MQDLRARQDERGRVSLRRLLSRREELRLPRDTTVGIVRGRTDERGVTHTRLQPKLDGIPIRTGQIIAHIDAKGRELTPTLPTQSLLSIERQTPRVSPDEAISKALAHLGPKARMPWVSRPQLVYYPRSRDREGFALLYEMAITPTSAVDGLHKWVYRVDAQTGQIFHSFDSVREAAAKGLGLTIYSGPVVLNTTSKSGAQGPYTLRDLTRGNEETSRFNETMYSPTGSLELIQGRIDTSVLRSFVDTDNVWGNGTKFVQGDTDFSSPTAQTSAAEVHFGVQATWNLFKEVFSLDGPAALGPHGGERTIAIVNIHQISGVNPIDRIVSNSVAFDDIIVFGSSAPNGLIHTDLELVGHELGHVFLFNTAAAGGSPGQLNFGETGGISEATADIIGIATKTFWDWRKGKMLGIGAKIEDIGNWLFGDAYGPAFTRYFHLPSLDGRSYDFWTTTIDNEKDPYLSAGPMRRAFYFLTRGASRYDHAIGADNSRATRFVPDGFPGMGLQRALELWVAVLLDWVAGDPTFSDFRAGCLSAAASRWGKESPEHKTVQDAFAAVNVGSPADRTEPKMRWAAKQTRHVVTLEASASDSSGVAQLSLSLVDPKGRMKTLKGKGNPLNISVTLPKSSFQEALYTVKLRAEDRARNVGVETSSLVIDKSPPTGFVVVPHNPGKLDRELHCYCSDNGAITRIEYFVDQIEGAQGSEPLVGTATSAPGPVQLSFTVNQQGRWWAYAKVYDASGWTYETPQRSFLVDVEPPVVTSAAVLSAEKGTGTRWNLRFGATVADNLLAAGCDWSVEGSGVCGTTHAGETFTCSSTYWGEEGDYTGSAVCKDWNGNTDKRDFNFTLGVPKPPPKACDEFIAAGTNQPKVFEVDLGKASGNSLFMRRTFNVPDQFRVRCREGGRYGFGSEFSTQCESTGNYWYTANSSYECNSSIVEVEVIPNCEGTPDTEWEVRMPCP